MSIFIDALNESAVTYIPDVASYGWHVIPGSGAPQDGWEAISPFGEIRCFDTREAAHSWRMSQVREFVAWRTGAAPTVDPWAAEREAHAGMLARNAADIAAMQAAPTAYGNSDGTFPCSFLCGADCTTVHTA